MLQKIKHSASNSTNTLNGNGNFFFEDKYCLIFNSVPSGIIYIDKQYNIRYANNFFKISFGIESQEVIGKSLTDLLDKKSFSVIKPAIETAVPGKKFHFELEVPFKDNTRFIDATFTPDIDEDGKIKGYTGLLNDLTEKKNLEIALQESENRYKRLIENLPAALYACDKQGRITMYNNAAVELWGREPEIGKDMWCGSRKIYQPDGITPLPFDTCPMAITLKEGSAVTDQEIVVERPDGKKINVQPYPIPIFDINGKISGAVNMLIDITERKIIEKDLGSLAAIVHSSADVIVSKTLNGIITSWNEAAERIFGYNADEMIGQPITKLIPDDRLNEEPMILDRLKRGEIVEHFETKRVTKDRKIIDISVTISPVKDRRGNIIGASKIARDITAQKELYSALKENEERLRMASEVTKLGNWEFNLITKKLIWSDECKMIYGVSKDEFELTGQFIIDHTYPEDKDTVHQEVLKALDPGTDGYFDTQYRIIKENDKQLRWVRVRGKVYFNNKQPERFIGTLLDITDEKKQEQELKDNIELFTTMADNVPVMIWMSGDDKFHDFFNKQWLEFTGRTLEEESNNGWLENVHPEDVQKCIDTYKHSFNEQKEFYIEYRLKRYDSTYRWIADNSVPRYDTDGNFAGFISACMDIDEQKRSREKIIESELLFKTISNASPAALWMTDKNEKNVFVSNTWLEWTGKPFEEQIDRGWLSAVLPEDKENVIAKFRESFTARKNFTSDFRFERKDGDIRWCLTEGSPYYDIEGEFVGYAGSVTDITDIKKMEERKDDFIKMASHELKTPVTSINGYVQLLLNIHNELNDEKLQASKPIIKSSLNTISKQVSKLTRLISELLDLTRIESGKLELRKTEFDLSNLIEETVQEVRYTTSQHAIIIHNDFDGIIYADKDRLSQVLLNLLTNAIKYSPDSDSIEVFVQGDKKSVTIKVKDYGIGIDEKNHSKVFERFYRVEGKSEQTYPGFGIGLFIAAEIIQRHKGTISVESKKNKGSVFIVTLPVNNRND